MWDKIDDPVGLKPRFPIFCPTCFLSSIMVNGLQRAQQMILRYTDITKLPTVSSNSFACNMHYKCPRCGEVKTFEVVISKEYYEVLLERRGGGRRTTRA